MKKTDHTICLYYLMPIRDALDLLSGKWKLQIIRSIMEENYRFSQIERSIPNLTSKVLAEELKDLEEHKLINRIVDDKSPSRIEYKLSSHADSLRGVLKVLKEWGLEHRKVVMDIEA